MAKGQAIGKNREYEKLRHDIILVLQAEKGLVPHECVAFPLCGTEVTFDAVLRDQQKSRFVVIESKRYGKKSPIKQRDVFAFWAEIKWLCEYLQTSLNAEVNVEGIMITKSAYQIGAVKAASVLGIKLAVLEQDQDPQGFAIAFRRLGPPNLVTQDVIVKAPTASYKFSGGSATFTIHRGGE